MPHDFIFTSLLITFIVISQERQVLKCEGQELAKELGADFFETSAAQGTQVKHAFLKLMEVCHPTGLSSVHTNINVHSCSE